MDYWSQAPQSRGQLVLFATRLDDALAADHSVRLLDEVLGRMDWTTWEAAYHGRLGQPPIHPRVMASVLLYGTLKRIRSSRALEEALRVRLDFHWLAEGRTIDHSTLSEFRRKQGAGLKDLFVRIGLVAREAGLLPLEQLAYDGTRIRANNRRSGTRTIPDLKQMREELSAKFAELEKSVAAEDARLDASLGQSSAPELPRELADVKQRLARVDAALQELSRVEAAGETVPSRLPLTDPEARMTPNKDGGFAPNYTPLATVDAANGFIVADDVIAMTDEEHYLVPQIQAVQENFQLSSPPAEMLGDGAMPSGENLTAMEEMGVTLYSPIGAANGEENPALREDVTQPVAAELWDRLLTIEVKNRSGEKQTQLTKEAFVYDAGNDCYWCPGGKKLSPRQPISLRRGKRLVQRTLYKAEQASCGACPLLNRCLQKNAQRRQVSRYLHDPLAEKLARRMATPEAKKKYARRREVCERPFAVIKQQFGARRFLLRGLAKVRVEWRWLTTAFNLDRLLSLLRSRDGPVAILS